MSDEPGAAVGECAGGRAAGAPPRVEVVWRATAPGEGAWALRVCVQAPERVWFDWRVEAPEVPEARAGRRARRVTHWATDVLEFVRRRWRSAWQRLTRAERAQVRGQLEAELRARWREWLLGAAPVSAACAWPLLPPPMRWPAAAAPGSESRAAA